MTSLFGLADHWLWLMAAALFAIGEMVIPGVSLIWVGAAALLTSAVALLLPIGTVGEFIVFAVSSVAAVVISHRYLRLNPVASPDPLLNDRGERLVGSTVIAVEPVDDTGGRVRVGDGVWSARGERAQPGDRLRVIGCDGTVLLVKRA